MKTFTTIFMFIVIAAGLVLAITPFIADKLFPVPEHVTRTAETEAAEIALQRFFRDDEAVFDEVQALNKTSPDARISWFSFSVRRKPVERYILGTKLEQKELTQAVLEEVFYSKTPPAFWWQPEALKQETYFAGKDLGRIVSLIYNPKSTRGLLVTRTPKQGDK